MTFDSPQTPLVTRTLIIANVIVFFIQMGVSEELLLPFALWPPGPQFHFWQLFTYAFLHGNAAHIFFNMFGLYMFGSKVERLWGAERFAIYYVACILSAAIVQQTASALAGHDYPAIGASGGVFGLLLAFALCFPRSIVILLFPPIPMPAWLFATIYGALELILGVTGAETGVAHFAHLGGMLGGYLVMRLWRNDRLRG